jgi:hypothetical protein
MEGKRQSTILWTESQNCLSRQVITSQAV